MKKISISIFVISILVIIGCVFAFGKKQSVQSVPLHVLSAKVQQNTPTAVPSTVPVPGIPKQIQIPKLHINAAIESVGMDREGRMDIPHYATTSAWFDLGFRPGQKGSAVIDGHFDTVTGAPAIFYTISGLQPGDKIIITDDKKQQYIFAVTRQKAYPFDQLPLKEIFGSAEKPRLNLITCDGTWDKKAKNYSNRTVVYSEMVQ